jgi:ferredoxin-nitrate reductase
MWQSHDSISEVWGERTPYHSEWPARVDERVETEPDTWVQSACVLCSNGCALDIGVKDGKIVGVRGREVDRVNKGRLGPKGLHGWVANNSPERLTKPLIRENGVLREATWDEAMQLIVTRSREIRDKYTGGAIGFYNTGQLFIEDYYTLSVIAHAGLGTHQMDGNTRLCTATAAISLHQTFGSDGQPASYSDVDVTDCILHVGHNVANTQTVLWSRILDRKRGPNPPKIIAVDPRATHTAREADVHLAPRISTNVAVLNGLLHLIIEAGCIDQDFIEKHTVGFDELKKKVAPYTPEKVQEISGVPADKLREAAHILGTAPTLLSTALQGVYQSNQATAAACQINNLNLIRGMIGKPGCGILQMNGQPTAQNTRECGCDGEFPAFRNWQNPEHIHELARVWNVEPSVIPHWHEPAHAMEIFRHAETGSVKMLWIIATNPAVSMPELHRIRKILSQEKLFVVVQDAFLTETARLADVVLPTAIWGEKTGTFTNTDRTVHISYKAVEPPGEARPDMAILLDYSRRMDFHDKDGAPLIKWSTPEGAFEAWKECSRGRVCDYTGLSYEKLSGGSGIQWPCNEEHVDGCERLYSDFIFPTSAEVCETYGNDIETGAARTPEEYKANDPKGRAILKAADYHPPEETPDDKYPFWLTTGRVVYHFHTRTKTGRSKELHDAAPDAFVQLNEADAERLGITEGELVEIASRRGSVQAPARIGGIEPGQVFIPFHYGDIDAPDGRTRAANELTITGWDPVSKQPYFKYAAVQVHKAGAAPLPEKLSDIAGKVLDAGKEVADKVLSSTHVEQSRVSDYLGILNDANEQFAAACRSVGAGHFADFEITTGLKKLAQFSDEAATSFQPFGKKYGCHEAKEPQKLRQTLFPTPRTGAFGILRDLHNLFILASEIHIALTIVMQASKQLRDEALLEACIEMDTQNKRQQAWLITQINHRAPHTLVVPA